MDNYNNNDSVCLSLISFSITLIVFDLHTAVYSCINFVYNCSLNQEFLYSIVKQCIMIYLREVY